MKKILIIVSIALFLGSCSTYYQYDNTNRVVSKERALSPLGKLLFTTIVYTTADYYLGNNHFYYSYNTYGNRVYSHNYYTGNLVNSTHGQQYCHRTCSLVGLGHIHHYYFPRQPIAYDYLNNRQRYQVNTVTNQYYYNRNKYLKKRKKNYKRKHVCTQYCRH